NGFRDKMSEKYSDITAWLQCFLQNRADIVPMFARRIGLLMPIFHPRFRHRLFPHASLGWSRLAASMTAKVLECDTSSREGLACSRLHADFRPLPGCLHV